MSVKMKNNSTKLNKQKFISYTIRIPEDLQPELLSITSQLSIDRIEILEDFVIRELLRWRNMVNSFW